MTVKIYQTKDHKEPYQEWFQSIVRKDKSTAARISNRLLRIEKEGNLGDQRTVGAGVFELKFRFGAGYRIYFGRVGDEVVILLSGGDKRTQTKDIEIAKRYWKDYKTRVKNG